MSDIYDAYVLLDMDRTLLDSDASIRIQCGLLKEFGIDKERADAALEAILASKGSAYPASQLLEEMFGRELMERMQSRLLEIAETDQEFKRTILYGDASRRLIDAIRKNGYGLGILTHGDERNQRQKLAMVRAALHETPASLPAIITSVSEKSIHIGTWIDEKTGLVMIPAELTAGSEVLARHVVVIDDKHVNVIAEDNHDFIRGIHIDNHDTPVSGLQTTEQIAEQLEQGIAIMDIARHYAKGKIDKA